MSSTKFRPLLIVFTDGHLFSWGMNSDGQLGIGVSENRTAPSQFVYIHPVTHLWGLAVSHIAAGSRHSVALTVSGALFMWGNNR